MSKKLEAGVTFIGMIKAKDKNNILLDFDLLYGNVLTPPINGKIGHLPINKYNQILRDFLDSDEGREYDIPTEEEVEQASIEMLNKETIILNSMKGTPSVQISQEAKPSEPVQTDNQNVNTPKDTSEVPAVKVNVSVQTPNVQNVSPPP